MGQENAHDPPIKSTVFIIMIEFFMMKIGELPDKFPARLHLSLSTPYVPITPILYFIYVGGIKKPWKQLQ